MTVREKQAAARLWNKGKNTAEIAALLALTQAEVANESAKILKAAAALRRAAA